MTIVLWEHEIPPSSYGYWILESGECLPVADMKHAVVAADYLESLGVITGHDMERYELMFKSGSIRVTMSNAVYTGELNVGFQCDLTKTSASAIASLIQICRTERPDTVTKDFWNAVAGWTLPFSKALLKLNEIKQQLKKAAVLNESDEDDSRRQELDREFVGIRNFRAIARSDDTAKHFRLIEWSPHTIYFFNNPTINLQIAAVKHEPWAIDSITDPPPLIQFLAFSELLNKHGDPGIGKTIKLISNLDPSIQLMIIEKRPELFPCIQNPTPEAIALYKQKMSLKESFESDDYDDSDYPRGWSLEQQIDYVKEDWRNIESLINPSLPVQIAAVKNDSRAITVIDNPSALIQYIVVSDLCSLNGFLYPNATYRNTEQSFTLENIKNLETSLQMKIVKEMPVLFPYIQNPTAEATALYKQKIKNTTIVESDDIFPTQIDPGAWPSTWLDADNWPEAEKIEYLKHYPEDLGNFTNPSLAMQLTAVQRSGLAILQIYNPAPLIQFAAYKQNPESITWVEPRECRLPALVKQYEEIHGLSNLTEAVIPPTRYGYWIMPDGKYVAVDYTNHEQVAMEILDVTDMAGPACLPRLLRQGAIRVVSNYERGSMEFEITKESRPALRSLVRLIMAEKPEKIVADWGDSVIQGDWQQVTKRINAYLSNQTLQENQTTVAYGSWILSDGSKIEVGYEQHQKIARERFGCRNYAEMFDQGAIRVVNEHWSKEWEKIVETEVAWGMQTPPRKALRALRNEIRRVNPTLKIFFESGDAALDTADGYDGEVFESATKFLRFINQLIEQSVNPNISTAESEELVSIDVKMQLASVKNDWVSIKSIKDPVVAVQLAAVEKNGYAIQFIKDPVVEVQLAAVKQNATSIEVIHNPPVSVQHAAIKRNPEIINFIDPIEATHISLLQQYRDILNPARLEYLEKFEKENLQEAETFDDWSGDPNTWSEEKQICYVKMNSNNIKKIHNPSISVQLAAVTQHAHMIFRINNPAPLVQFAACQKDAWAINFIRPLESADISLLQQYRDILCPDQLQYLAKIEKENLQETEIVDDWESDPNTWSEEKQIKYVQTYYKYINAIKHPSIKVQLTACNENPRAICYIYRPPPMIQFVVIKKLPSLINWIVPIESIDISLLKKHRDILDIEQNEYLEKLEKENLQEHANNLYGAWILEDGTFIPVTDRWGHDKALDKKKYSHTLNATTAALIKGCIRVVFLPGRLQLEWAKPTQPALTVFYNQVLEPRRSQLSDIVLTRYKSRSEVATIVQPEIRIMDSEKFANWLGKIIRRFDSLQDLTEAAYDVADPNTWPEERQVELVKRSPWNIEEISDPSAKVQLAALQSNWRAIECIKQPSLEVQLYVVQQSEYGIHYIFNPFPMIQAAACSKHPRAINHIHPIESVDLGLMNKYYAYLKADCLEYFDQIKDTLTESVATEIYQLPKGTYGGWISPTGTFLKVDRMFGHEKIASEMGYNRNYDFLADGAIRLIFGGNITNQLQIEMHQPSKQACRALQNLVREIDFQEIQIEYQANNKRLSKKFNMLNLSDKKKLQELLTTI